MESIVAQEAHEFVDTLTKEAKANPTMRVNELFIRATNNSVWRLMTGKETKQDSARMDEVMVNFLAHDLYVHLILFRMQ